MAVRIPKKGPVHLRFDDGQVFVTPQDYDHFLIAARSAVEALKRACEVDEWAKRFFDEYVPILHNWCASRAPSVDACFVALPKGPALKVFLVSKGAYDQELGKEVSRLELELEDKDWPTDMVQIPAGDEEELKTYFNPEESVLVYAQT
jgi:hypothetical protein